MKFRYEELEIVKDIHQLITHVYQMTERWPVEERYGLTSQARRAATSIVLNIAEGSARRSSKEYARFIKIAIGSLVELDAAMKVAITLRIIKTAAWEQKDELLKKIFYTLTAVRKTVEQTMGQYRPS